MRSDFSKKMILLYLCVVWGTTWIAIKFSLEGIPPLLGAMARFLVAIVCLWVYMASQKISLKPPVGSFGYLFISAILLYLFDYGFIYWGEQYLYAGVTAIFFATFPLFTGIVSNFVFRHEAFQWSKFIGLLISFCGITAIFYDQLLLTNFNGIVIWASLAIIIGAFCGAVALVMTKKYLGHVETVSLAFHQMIWGVLILGVIGAARGEIAQIHLTPRSVMAVIYLGTFGTAIAFVFYYSLLKKMSAITLSSIIYINPLVAILTGWIFLDEKITLRIIIGTLFILGGIAISQLPEYRKLLKKWESKREPYTRAA